MTRISMPAVFTMFLVALVGCASSPSYEVHARVTEPIGNIAVSPDGRVFVSMHQFFETDFRVGEVIRGAGPDDARVTPYPPGAWQKDPAPDRRGLVSVLGIACDAQGILWMLDNGLRLKTTPRLVAWDTTSNALHRVIEIPPPASGASMLNDLAVDRENNSVYVVDMGSADNPPALIVVDLASGDCRRVLESHESVMPEAGLRMTIDGRTLGAVIGLNPIVLDDESAWLYFGAMSGRSLWRIRTRDLLDTSLDDRSLGARVQRYADKAISDGVTMDSAGNVYISDLQASGIGVSRPDGAYEMLFSGPELSWPDAMSVGPDGFIYVAANELHRSAPLNNGVDATTPPYHVIRFRPLAPAEVGR